MSDYYTVFLLNPKNGNRYVLEGVQAEVEPKHEFAEFGYQSYGHKHKFPTKNWLDIVLTIDTPSETSQIEELKEQILFNELYLYFKDVHPNLIRGRVKNVTMDYQKVTINFKGNTTNKEYHDFITEVSNQLEAYQYHWQTKHQTNKAHLPIEGDKPEQEPIKERKVKILKRKLTF